MTISGTEKRKTTWNTWLERGAWGGSLEGRHERSCDYSGRWLLILWVISLCWLEKIHLQEVNNFSSKCFQGFYISTGNSWFQGKCSYSLQMYQKRFGWNVLVSLFVWFFFPETLLWYTIIKENWFNRVLFLTPRNTRFPVSLRQLLPLFHWLRHWNLSGRSGLCHVWRRNNYIF